MDARHGLLLGVAWKIFRACVIAILMAVHHYVNILVAIAFDVAETVHLYEQLYLVFPERFGLDLSQYTLESDQRSAICTFCKNHGQRRLLSLRHFLLSLKKKAFSLQVGNLVKCRTTNECESLKTAYEREFAFVNEVPKVTLVDSQ
jgi:hypothetical protein